MLQLGRGGMHVEPVPSAQLADLSSTALAAQLAAFASTATDSLRRDTLP